MRRNHPFLDAPGFTFEPDAAWHSVLSPLPAEIRPARRPVGASLPAEQRTAIEGWHDLVITLNATHGLRNFMVVLDGDDRAIAASEMVLHQTEVTAPNGERTMRHVHHSVGGRIESNGAFNGTTWRTRRVGDIDDSDEAAIESVMEKEVTSDADARALLELVADVVRRSPAP